MVIWLVGGEGMKNLWKIVFWAGSILFLLCALAISFENLLSGAMLLACAILINPVFIRNIKKKKGLTALLILGLFTGSFAVFSIKTTVETEPIMQTNYPRKQEEAISKTYWTIVPETSETKGTEGKYPGDLSIYGGTSAAESLSDKVLSETPTPKTTMLPTPTMIPTPTIKPTAIIQPTPTIKPTATTKPTHTIAIMVEASPTPASKQTRASGIEIIEYTDVIGRGEYASIEIKGRPNTDYTCEVRYKTQMSTAKGLGEKTSDSEGYVSWSWKVGTNTSLDYRPTITISGGGDSIRVQFKVVE